MRSALYVGSLASHEDGRELAQLFSAYGTVVYAKVVTYDDLIRRHGGFGVVEMGTERETHTALRALDHSEFRGRTLSVRAATAAEQTAAGHPRMFETMNMADDAEEYS
jgi:RNA recognition motif-containing protein